VTLRACAGLNGMRLGSTILTVVQATPDAGPEAASAETPFYGVPEQAKPLLQTATRILELRNLVCLAMTSSVDILLLRGCKQHAFIPLLTSDMLTNRVHEEGWIPDLSIT
jgi:hypothetical protein